jgi:hypothetical protein
MEIASIHGNRIADAIDSSIVVSGGSGDTDENEASPNPPPVVNSVIAEVINHFLFWIVNY